MKFESNVIRLQGGNDYGVYAVDPRQGNDAALLAVFDNAESAARLARLFTSWTLIAQHITAEAIHSMDLDAAIAAVQENTGVAPPYQAECS